MNKDKDTEHDDETPSRRLLSLFNQSDVGVRRVLAAAGTDKCAAKVRMKCPPLILIYNSSFSSTFHFFFLIPRTKISANIHGAFVVRKEIDFS